MPKVAADSLEWHDAGIYSVEEDLPARRMIWQVEMFRWDIGDDGDAQPGLLTFEAVERVEALHDLHGRFTRGEVDWEVLEGRFERHEGTLQCEFLLELPSNRTALGGAGFGALVVVCRDAWFLPSAEHTP